MSMLSCAHCGREKAAVGIPCPCWSKPCDHQWRASGDYEYCIHCSLNRKPDSPIDWQSHYKHQFSEDRVQAALDRIERQQATLLWYFTCGEKRIMATLKDIIDMEGQDKPVIAGLVDAVGKLQDDNTALKKALADALAKGPIPPDIQADIDAAFAASKDNHDAVQDLLAKLATPAVEVPVADGGTVTEAPAA